MPIAATPQFKLYAPQIMFDLSARFKLSDMHSAAIVGNAGRESGGFTELVQLDDKNPGRGIGLFQYSGIRHVRFANFCAAKKLGVESIAASVLFLMYELSTSYSYALRELIATKSLYEATFMFERLYEAAGVPAIQDRFEWAQIALALPRASHGVITAENALV